MPLPVPEGCVASVGPLELPHQLPEQSIVVASVEVNATAKPGGPLAKLLFVALFVPIVPTACVPLKRMSAFGVESVLFAPLPMKKFSVTTQFCAPRSAPVLPKLVSAMP